MSSIDLSPSSSIPHGVCSRSSLQSGGVKESGLKRLVALLIFILFILGFVMQSVGWFNAAPGDLGDPRLNSYFLEHVWLWLSGAKVSLWSPAFFYPFSHILGFSDNHFGSVGFYSIFRFLGAPREYAFDAWFVIGALLNYWASFWALRQWRFGLIASALGAFVFSASLPVLMADNAAQLNYRFAIPLAWLMFYRCLTQVNEKTPWFYFGIACLCVAEQFLCSIYLGLLLVYCLGAMLLAWWCTGRKKMQVTSDADLVTQKIPNQEQGHLFQKIVGVSFAALAIWAIGALLFQYHQIAHQYGLSRDNKEVIQMLPKVGSYFLSERSFVSSLWSKNLGWFAQRQENQLFIGLGVMLFFLGGIVSSWRSKRLPHATTQLGKISSIAIAIVCLMTMQVAGYSFYGLLLQLPGINAIRSVGRVILVMLFPVSILVAIAVQTWQEWFLSKADSKKSIASAALLLVLPLIMVMSESIFAHHDTTLLSRWQSRMQRLHALLPDLVNEDAILFVPRSGDESTWAGELDGMLFAQDLAFPTINGYSGSLPPGYPDLGVDALTRFQAYAKVQAQPDDWIAAQLSRVITLKTNMAWLKKQDVKLGLNESLLLGSGSPKGQLLLVQGWALPEPWGTWIAGSDAQLLVPLPKLTNADQHLAHALVLKVRPFINAAHPQLTIRYQVNHSSSRAVQWRWGPGSPEDVLRIPITASDLEKGYLDIGMHIDNPISPKTLGMGDDERVLGLGLESITLQ